MTAPAGNAVVEITATDAVNVDDVYDFFVDGDHCATNCTLDTDCFMSELHRCIGNICVVPCTTDGECLFGQTCDTTTSTCRPVSAVPCSPTVACSASETCVLERDGVPDDVSDPPDGVPDVFAVCVPSGITRTSLVPLNYWVDIKRVRAGSAVAEQITDPALADGPVSVTPTSANPPLIGVSPARPSFDTDTYSHVYANPRRLDESHADLIVLPAVLEGDIGVPVIGKGAATGNPAYCPFGVPVSAPATFSFDLEVGDTALVQARKLSPPAIQFLGEPTLTARLLLNGVPQTPDGTTSSSVPGGSFSFSFTVR
jgi:hypothetical protein